MNDDMHTDVQPDVCSDHFQRILYTLQHLLFFLQTVIINDLLIKKPCPAADVTILEGVGITVDSFSQNNDPGREESLHRSPKPA